MAAFRSSSSSILPDACNRSSAISTIPTAPSTICWRAAKSSAAPATERAALEVSPIFDWYRQDFESDYGGVRSREQFFARYAALLADRPEERAAIASGKVPLRFLEYDWRLNDVPRAK
jgi:hypothetical protein